MKKMTVKLLLVSLLAMMIASIIPNLIWIIITGSFTSPIHSNLVTPAQVLLIGSITSLTAIFLYGFFIHHMLVKRIKQLNIATQQVMKGHYDTHLPEKGKDELSLLTQNFNQMTNALNSNAYASKMFVTNFSHELKTPLSVIHGYAELLKDMTLTDEERDDYLSIIIHESKRVSRLSKQMIFISQIDSQTILPQNDTYNMTEQIRRIIQTMQLTWEAKQLQFDLDITDESITSNKELTYQVWSNLIDNAIKFSSEHDTIHIQLSKKGQEIHAAISNPGHLNETQQAQVFDLFYKGKTNRSVQSSGIGLALVKKIMTRLNGQIQVSSTDDTVTFKLVFKAL